ncbi:hypothetical protein [Roseovarius sp.]|uniref:terminase small subunit-like protein n=1 Tax=Roseovarius sp. TaxID=1486281 RepID=UPI003BA9EE4B
MPRKRITDADCKTAYDMREAGETWKAIAEAIGCAESKAKACYHKHEAKLDKEQYAKNDGRPTKYSRDMSDRICDMLSRGKTIDQIAAMDDMPVQATIYDWKRDHAEFSEAIARARVDQTWAWAEQILTIADDIQQDVARNEDGTVRLNDKGQPVYIKEMPQRTKLRIETRQWIMERVNRGDFGNRQQMDVHHHFADKDDAEILHELRTAAEAAGLSPDDVTALLSGEQAIH